MSQINKPRRRTSGSSWVARIVAEARPRFIAGLALAVIAAAGNYVVNLDRAVAGTAHDVQQLKTDVRRLQGGTPE